MKNLIVFAAISTIIISACTNRHGHGMEVDNPSVNTETVVQKDTSTAPTANTTSKQ
ncbi:MAG: hypothetical protein U0T84_08645 [Chitinophagales bacterium]